MNFLYEFKEADAMFYPELADYIKNLKEKSMNELVMMPKSDNEMMQILLAEDFITDVSLRLYEMVSAGCGCCLSEKSDALKRQDNAVLTFDYFCVDVLGVRDWDTVRMRYGFDCDESIYDALFYDGNVIADGVRPRFVEYDGCLCMRFRVRVSFESSDDDVEAVFRRVYDESAEWISVRYFGNYQQGR